PERARRAARDHGRAGAPNPPAGRLMAAPRLSRHAETRAGVRRPAYLAQRHGVGIVHIGVGAFHRAHQAVYTDEALATAGGDWRIAGVSLRSTDIADALNPQDGLYTL